jgi:hypothetical protein
MDNRTLQALVALNNYERTLDHMEARLDDIREAHPDNGQIQLILDRQQTRMDESKKRTKEMRGLILGQN